MFEPVIKFFRRRKIRKYSKAIPTSLKPLSEIKTANVVIDVEEVEWDSLKEEILAWGRNNGIKVSIYFFDFRKLGKEELLLTSIQTTILKKELDWLGYPKADKTAGLTEEATDLFVSLIDSSVPAIDLISKCANARFKIGRRYYEGHAFDMIISGTPNEDLRSDSRLILKEMIVYLSKIQ